MSDWILKITAPEVTRFLEEHARTDEHQLLLGHATLFGLPARLLAQQLKGKRKAAEKLPSWHCTPGLVYPSSVALEQCSSEVTARFKLERIRYYLPQSRLTAADLTGGLGVDCYYLSTIFNQVEYVEPDASLLEISRHNHQVLGAGNIRHHAALAEEFLSRCSCRFDLLFADPSRKSRSGKKVIRLQDCSPDITTLFGKIFATAGCFALKASPLLDLQNTLRQLPFVAEINVVAANNEVKELFFLSVPGYHSEPVIRAVNLKQTEADDEALCFTLNEEHGATVNYSAPLTWVYEPNRAILKAGAFRLAGSRFGLHKLHPNTHLYTGETLMEHFPGRVFHVQTQAQSLIKNIKGSRAHVIVRNYPATADMLSKRFRLTPGGDHYLIACTSVQGKHLLLARRVQ